MRKIFFAEHVPEGLNHSVSTSNLLPSRREGKLSPSPSLSSPPAWSCAFAHASPETAASYFFPLEGRLGGGVTNVSTASSMAVATFYRRRAPRANGLIVEVGGGLSRHRGAVRGQRHPGTGKGRGVGCEGWRVQGSNVPIFPHRAWRPGGLNKARYSVQQASRRS